MKPEDFEKLHQAQADGKKVRGRKKDGTFTKEGTVEAGLGTDVQIGVRLAVRDLNGNKVDDEYLLWTEIEDVEVID
jgi:hypothetical protein